jgi:hypothetical protein
MQPFVITIKKALLLQIKQRSPERSIIRTREQQTDGPTEGKTNCTGKYGSDRPHQQLNHSDLKPDGHLPDIKNDSCFGLVTPHSNSTKAGSSSALMMEAADFFETWVHL